MGGVGTQGQAGQFLEQLTGRLVRDLFGQLGDRPLDVRKTADIGRQRARQPRVLPGDRFDTARIAIEHADPGAFLQEPGHGGRPDPAGTSGDQDALALQTAHGALRPPREGRILVRAPRFPATRPTRVLHSMRPRTRRSRGPRIHLASGVRSFAEVTSY